MLKTHKVTGLKYLCYHKGSKESCCTYPGSGLIWRQHLRKNGYNIDTEILLETDNKEDIKIKGLEYSKLWDIVDSDKFANLVPEDGSGGHENMHKPEARKKAIKTLLERHRVYGLSEKEEAKGPAMSQRKQQGIFTQAELDAARACSNRQLGKTMQDRVGADYIDPRKGKSAKEIYGDQYTGPYNKGKTMKEIKGADYIKPTAKAFKVTINKQNGTIFTHEADFFTKTGLNTITLSKLKKKRIHTIKRQSNSRHNYQTGDVLELQFI